MQAATSIYIREDLKDQLNSLKRHSRESYNDVIERLVHLAIDDELLLNWNKAVKVEDETYIVPITEVIFIYG